MNAQMSIVNSAESWKKMSSFLLLFNQSALILPSSRLAKGLTCIAVTFSSRFFFIAPFGIAMKTYTPHWCISVEYHRNSIYPETSFQRGI